MVQITIEFIEDESNAYDKRVWVYEHFGTSARSAYTMFEATFSAGWVPVARTLIEDVNSFLGIFWVLYIILINFTVMRVVAAIFLKQTMSAANDDAERVAMATMKDREKFGNVLHQ